MHRVFSRREKETDLSVLAWCGCTTLKLADLTLDGLMARICGQRGADAPSDLDSE